MMGNSQPPVRMDDVPKSSIPMPDILARDADGFRPMDAADSKEDRLRAAHVMYFARTDEKHPYSKQDLRALVLMTLRDDGSFGFPGGVVEAGETPEAAAAREAREEIHAGEAAFAVAGEDFLCCHLKSHPLPDRPDVELHFFTKEVPLAELKRAEREVTAAEMFGTETMGLVRVPLFHFGFGGDRGLPVFLRNVFAGNARSQLLHGLYVEGLLTLDEIQATLKKSKEDHQILFM